MRDSEKEPSNGQETMMCNKYMCALANDRLSQLRVAQLHLLHEKVELFGVRSSCTFSHDFFKIKT